MFYFVFFFNDTATTEIYTLSLHDALPIWLRGRHLRPAAAGALRHLRRGRRPQRGRAGADRGQHVLRLDPGREDRKSTRLNSSHANISYAVFCLKKKKTSKGYEGIDTQTDR